MKSTIQFLTKGCSCKKGCASNNCGCRIKSKHCGPGCECQGCVNLPTEEATTNSGADETSDDKTPEESESNDSSEELQMKIVTEDFFFDTIDVV